MVRGYILCKLDVSLLRVKKGKVVVKSGSGSFCNFHLCLSPSLFFFFLSSFFALILFPSFLGIFVN